MKHKILKESGRRFLEKQTAYDKKMNKCAEKMEGLWNRIRESLGNNFYKGVKDFYGKNKTSN
jgi:hypothetical protein